jgi:protein ImuA
MGSGAATLALRTALNAAGNQDASLVVVDCDGDFYPPAAAAMGLPVDRLVVIRTGRAADAFWATEQALRCRSVGAVLATRLMLDEVRSRRLQLAAERSGGMALVLNPFKKSTARHSFAAVRLLIEPLPVTPRQSGMRRFRVTVLKVREGMPVEPVILDTTDETFDVPLHPVSADRAPEQERSIEQRISA